MAKGNPDQLAGILQQIESIRTNPEDFIAQRRAALPKDRARLSPSMRRRRLTSLPDAACVKTKISPVYSYDHLVGSQCFTSVLSVTYKLAEVVQWQRT